MMKRFAILAVSLLLLASALLFSGRGALSAPPAAAADKTGAAEPIAVIRREEEGTMAYCNPGKGEAILLGSVCSRQGLFWGGKRDHIQEARDAAVPNTVLAQGTYSAAGITSLHVSARLFGVVVELVDGDAFTFAYVGADKPDSVTLSREARDGRLTVAVRGAENQQYYVNTSADNRSNVLVVGVPAGVVQAVSLDCSTSCVLVSGLDVPVVCDTANAMVAVGGDTLTQPISLTCGNGCVSVFGKTITGDVTLSAQNGSVSLRADTLRSGLLQAKNGSVEAEVEEAQTLSMQAENGSVKAVLGTVAGHVSAGVSNGMLDVRLTRRPQDLTLRCTGRPLLYALPSDWYDGYTVGSGIPVLELSTASNGVARFALGEAPVS